jgi:hypothetical protein
MMKCNLTMLEIDLLLPALNMITGTTRRHFATLCCLQELCKICYIRPCNTKTRLARKLVHEALASATHAKRIDVHLVARVKRFRFSMPRLLQTCYAKPFVISVRENWLMEKDVSCPTIHTIICNLPAIRIIFLMATQTLCKALELVVHVESRHFHRRSSEPHSQQIIPNIFGLNFCRAQYSTGAWPSEHQPTHVLLTLCA